MIFQVACLQRTMIEANQSRPGGVVDPVREMQFFNFCFKRQITAKISINNCLLS